MRQKMARLLTKMAQRIYKTQQAPSRVNLVIDGRELAAVVQNQTAKMRPDGDPEHPA